MRDVDEAGGAVASNESDDLPMRYRGCTDLTISLRAKVLAIGLNRPAKRNAIGVEMTLDLERTFLTVHNDSEVAVVVIHGHGGNFSGGMDMRDFFDHSTRAPAQIARARLATDHWRARLMRRLPQPIVCGVAGYCLGGALPIIECADIVLADPAATFGLPEINFGFVPGGPIAKTMRTAASMRGASFAALTGRPFDAGQAERWGLVTRLARTADVVGEALRLAVDIAHSRESTADITT